MSIVVGTGKNARVRLNTGELQNGKKAEKKIETPTEGADATKGKGGKSGGKGKGNGKKEAPKTKTPTEGTDGNENQIEE